MKLATYKSSINIGNHVYAYRITYLTKQTTKCLSICMCVGNEMVACKIKLNVYFVVVLINVCMRIRVLKYIIPLQSFDTQIN